jgi:hypothetical protein
MALPDIECATCRKEGMNAVNCPIYGMATGDEFNFLVKQGKPCMTQGKKTGKISGGRFVSSASVFNEGDMTGSMDRVDEGSQRSDKSWKRHQAKSDGRIG